MHGAPQAFVEERRRDPLIRPPPQTALARAMATKQPVQIADIVNEPHYFDVPSGYSAVVLIKLAGARTVLAVPMLKENELIGAIVIYRTEVRPFTDKQIELVKNFAAQAVIAIENARLLNELRQRTDDLSGALEQQTATSHVLQIISSSPGHLAPVFQAILENAVRLCGAKFGTLWMAEKDDHFRSVASHAVPPALAELRRSEPVVKFDRSTGLGRVVRTKQVVHVVDMSRDPAYLAGNPRAVTLVDLGGARTVMFAPMLKDYEVIGALTIYRQEVRAFTEEQIDLVRNFAAQAVIAIENARLLNDLNKLNQQLEQRVSDQVSEIERMGRLRRFLPPQVADLIVASGTEKQLESHRREITALFCDLRGFTGFSESSDPEDVMELLREYHAAIGGIINKYGGTLERYAGDGVMVVFNDPIPVDNPALQAVLMAIDMRAAIGELIEKWRKLGHDIGFGIGIAHGFATLGTIGFEGRFDYAAIGTVSNVASRLCDEAKPGQILISPRVLMAVEKDVTVEPVGDFALKGIRRPLTAYNVLATKAAD
jgi:class 3 adenylate cyclase